MTTEQEKRDLEILHRLCDEIRKSAFDGMRHSERMNPEELKASGNKTNEAAIVSFYRHYQKEIDTLIKKHLKKYPDSN